MQTTLHYALIGKLVENKANSTLGTKTNPLPDLISGLSVRFTASPNGTASKVSTFMWRLTSSWRALAKLSAEL
jgi:hypothetical protein